MGNFYSGRTTHPRKAARRARAAERFSISKSRCERGDQGYQLAKMREAAALGIGNPVYR